MKQVLAELQSLYNPYEPLWDEWTMYRQCALSLEDIHLLNIHASNQFQVPVEESIMFYNKEVVIKDLTAKLKVHYKSYKEWVVEKFVASLLYRGYKNDIFFSTPIAELSISAELKDKLQLLNVETVSILLHLGIANKLTKKVSFDKIVACQVTLLKEEKLHSVLKMEVVRDI